MNTEAISIFHGMCTCFWVGPPVAPSVCSDWDVMGAMGIECEGEVLGVLDSGMDAEFSSTSSEGQKVGEKEEGRVQCI